MDRIYVNTCDDNTSGRTYRPIFLACSVPENPVAEPCISTFEKNS